MECEMCGKKVGTRRYMVEGNVMRLGMCCGKFGTPMDAPAEAGSKAQVQQGLERRATRMTSKNIYSEEQWEFVEDFGKRIHDAREKRGLTKEALGSKVHARVPELNKFEAGQLRPTEQQTKALEKELGITLRERVQDNATTATPKAKGSAGLTIGDILKDAMNK